MGLLLSLPTGYPVRLSLHERLLSGCIWSLFTLTSHWALSAQTVGLFHDTSSSKLALDSKRAQKIHLPSIPVAGGYNLWPLDGDHMLIRQSAEVETDQSPPQGTNEQSWLSERGGF